MARKSVNRQRHESNYEEPVRRSKLMALPGEWVKVSSLTENQSSEFIFVRGEPVALGMQNCYPVKMYTRNHYIVVVTTGPHKGTWTTKGGPLARQDAKAVSDSMLAAFETLMALI